MAVRSALDDVKSAVARRLYELLEPRFDEMWEDYLRARLQELYSTHGEDFVLWLVQGQGDVEQGREIRLPERYRPGHRPPRKEISLFR